MTGVAKGNILSIPPGVAFLQVLADALVTDAFGFGLPDPVVDPMALAGVTVYLPTRRAARVLRSEIADRLATGSAILPVIRALGETDDDTGYFEEATPAALELDPPVGTVDAVLSLAELVIAWKARLPEVIAAHLDGAPMMAPASPADAVWLARALFDLVQAVESEEADFGKLDDAVEADLQEWWKITAEFLRVAREFWPALLTERHQSSPAAHHNALIDAESRRIAEGRFEGPVIVAGSTGTRPSTARLIAAVAGHPRGAVVLPGLDRLMTAAHWSMLADLAEPPDSGFPNPSARLDAVTIRSHPQYGLFRLLGALGLPPSAVHDIPELGTPPPTIAARNRLVSTALLPAAATTAWSNPAGSLPADEITQALEGVTLIEAANEREEAEALAAAMRAALEPTADISEPVAALVTPDRGLARRVVIELARYGIEADDSGGRNLGDTLPGSLARLVVAVAFAPADPVALAALLKHPLARFGHTSAEARRRGEMVEALALRGGSGEALLDHLDRLIDAGQKRRGERHAPAWLRRIEDTEIDDARAHARALRAAFAPLTGLVASGYGTAPASELALATARVLEAVASQENGALVDLWGEDAGKALAALLAACRDSRSTLAMTGFEWIAALEALMSGEVVKPDSGGHPRAFVWGALEARLQHVDTMLLAGLNEGSWPAPGTEDPFLSRAMKAAIGLEPPERRIGQAAHDMQMAIAMPRVVLSRSLRAGRAPTVASRWLQRLSATAGKEASTAMRERGEAILAHVRALEEGRSGTLPGRPKPKPPAEAQPTSYSFSEVGTLRRDPYAIYARRILILDAMDDFIADPGPRERGTLYHAILERFVREGAPHDLTEMRLMAIADEEFAKEDLPVEIGLVWRNRLARAAPAIAAWETARAGNREQTFVEAYAKMTLPSGPELRGLADRIEILADGSAALIDYKTGSSPSLAQARTLLDPQLALEAHVLGLGGFANIPPLPVSELLYLRLTGKGKYEDRVDKEPRKDDDPDYRAEALAARAAREFEGLVAALRDGRRGFMSRVIPKAARDFAGDYDHLARVAEWQVAAEGDNGGGDE